MFLKNCIKKIITSGFLALLLVSAGKSQITGESILQKVENRHQKYQNFSCEAILSLKVPNIRMPEKKLNIFFRKPDIVRVKTRGFSLLPRMRFFALIFPDPDSLSINSVEKHIDNEKLFYILSVNMTGLQDTMELWVDTGKYIVKKIISRDNKNNNMQIEIDYAYFNEILAPTSIYFIFNLDRSIPEFSPPSIKRPFGETQLFKNLSDENIQGEMFLKLSNYEFDIEEVDTVFSGEN